MKTRLVYLTIACMCAATPMFAQVVSKDSMQALNNRKEVLEIGKDINYKKIELTEKEKDLAEKTADAQKTAAKAQASAEANRQAAAALSTNPQDKKLAGNANSAAKDAQRDAKNARKDSDAIDKLNKDIAKLRQEIQEAEQKMATMTGAPAPGVPTTGVPASVQGAVTTPTISSQSQSAPASSTYNNSGYAGATTPGAAPQVIQRNITLDSLNNSSDPARIAQSVVESTYKNYSQQQGQPAIIINNIIIPPDYNRQNPAAAQPMQGSAQDLQDFEDYKAWLRYKRGQAAGAPYPAQEYSNAAPPDRPMTKEERVTFRERFGEKPMRNSGLWVIPMVGVHASNFNADFQDDQYDGRTGWNAGLDFRIRMKRFFIQPGVHYFNSSLDVTNNDDIANAPLLKGPRIHSLKAPLLLGLYLTKANKGFFKFNVKGGVVGNYILDVDRNDIDKFDMNNIEEFSYGLNAGFGIEFGFVTLDFSHEWGMSRVFKDVNQKNNILRGTIGFKL